MKSGLLKKLTIGLVAMALFVLSSNTISAQQQITTGDADAYTCAYNIVSTDPGYPAFLIWFNAHCQQTPTISPTCTPTPSVTETPTITPTPVTDPCANNGCGGPGDGLSDGRSDGRGSQPIQAVLGLSTTSSNNNALLNFAQLFVALGLSVIAFKLLKKKNA